MMVKHGSLVLSVLTASYNPGEYLPKAIDSVLPQLNCNAELCLQDAGSEDGTLRYLSSVPDPRIKVVSHPDGGQSDGLNQALARARGDWVLWMNADDIVFPGAIQAFETALIDIDPHTNIIYGSYARVDASGHEIFRLHPGEVSFRSLIFRQSRPWSGAIFIKRSYLNEVGGFREDYHFCMDFELYLRLWSDSRVHAICLPRSVPLGALRIHSGTKTTTSGWDFVWEARRARREHLDSWYQRLLAECPTVFDIAMQLTTRLRDSKFYGICRAREKNT